PNPGSRLANRLVIRLVTARLKDATHLGWNRSKRGPAISNPATALRNMRRPISPLSHCFAAREWQQPIYATAEGSGLTVLFAGRTSGLVRWYVYQIRWITVTLPSAAITHSTGAMRLNAAPRI